MSMTRQSVSAGALEAFEMARDQRDQARREGLADVARRVAAGGGEAIVIDSWNLSMLWRDRAPRLLCLVEWLDSASPQTLHAVTIDHADLLDAVPGDVVTVSIDPGIEPLRWRLLGRYLWALESQPEKRSKLDASLQLLIADRPQGFAHRVQELAAAAEVFEAVAPAFAP